MVDMARWRTDPDYGITERERRRPFIVKFRRGRCTYYVGSYFTKLEARIARDIYLRHQKASANANV